MNQRNRGIAATPEGIEKVRAVKGEKKWTIDKLAEEAKVSPDTVKRFLKGIRIDIDSVGLIAKALNIPTEELTKPINQNPEQRFLIHPQVCSAMLKEKLALTTNPLTTRGGATFESQKIYVPLGLVERKRQPQRSGDVCPEQGSSLYSTTDYEITRSFERDEFFEQVLAQGNTPKSQGKRIAIIGEPGAGKTTLLQQIADWVFTKTEQHVAIWVSLADLQGRNLEKYLLQVWLKDAFKRARVTPDMEDALVELFNRGQVWLVLDGVDEMAVDNPLAAIDSHIRGWVSSAKIVLTCRLNVWEAGNNSLYKFDVYRHLDFSHSQIQDFIDLWFASTPELKAKLVTELNQPAKTRILDLVKNPLRLALLCYSWQLYQGELPNNKAALYQRFVELFYLWKQEHFPTTLSQQRELNQALGNLAISALEQSLSRFRLSRRFVCQHLGEPDTQLFKLAMQLGWLNQVGVAAEDPFEPVYAFFHPTFQEYFAAQHIDDWHFLLNHVPDNPHLGNYRIFEAQWQEVIVLWLGRIDLPPEQLDNFIQALIEFEDGVGNFYRVRAYLIAKFASFELKKFPICETIVKHSNKWRRFEVNSQLTNSWYQITRTYPMSNSAIPEEVAALLEQSHVTFDGDNKYDAIAALIKLLDHISDQPLLMQIIRSLQFLGYGNQTVIQVLSKVLQTEPRYSFIHEQAAYSLWHIAPGNQLALDTLNKLLHNTQDEDDRLSVAYLLVKIHKSHPEAIATLVNFFRPGFFNHQASRALSALMEISAGDWSVLVDLLFPHQVGILSIGDCENEALVIINNFESTTKEYIVLNILFGEAENILTICGEAAELINAVFQKNLQAAVKAVQQYLPEYVEWENQYWNCLLEPYDFDESYYYLIDEDMQKNSNPFFQNRPASCFVYQLAERLIWSRTQNMNYPEFYELFHKSNSI